jgi:predicted PurR-regulated permease PerM
MFSIPQKEASEQSTITSTARWSRRLIISLTFLAWLALIIVVFNALGYVTTSLVILVMAALIAYAVVPLVSFLHLILPRPLAILIVYLIILGLIAFLFYLLIITSIAQVASLAARVSSYFASGAGAPSPIVQILRRFGIAQDQIAALSKSIADQLTSTAGNLAKDVVPLVTGVAGALVNVLLTAVISIYLLVDGERSIAWVSQNAPLSWRSSTSVLLDILRRVVGGYVRGQFVLCVIVGFLVGIGMFILRVPYAVLLGTLGGFLEFIPVLGTITSGVICCVLALTQGWLVFVLALIYFVLLHVFEGYILSPRIVGKAVGLHPVVSLLALTAGGELFGPLGAILAAPVAGLIQSIMISFWLYYRQRHQEQFSGAVQEEQAAEQEK